MKRSDFYVDKRKERTIDFLADYRVVRRYFCRKHNLVDADWEFLCKLHSLGTFIKADFENNKHTCNWNKNRWQNMLHEWIEVWRTRRPTKGQNYAIYTLTQKGKDAVESCYKILCGEKGIPETKQHNPIMKEETYTDKRYARAIREFNAERNKK